MVSGGGCSFFCRHDFKRDFVNDMIKEGTPYGRFHRVVMFRYRCRHCGENVYLCDLYYNGGMIMDSGLTKSEFDSGVVTVSCED